MVVRAALDSCRFNLLKKPLWPLPSCTRSRFARVTFMCPIMCRATSWSAIRLPQASQAKAHYLGQFLMIVGTHCSRPQTEATSNCKLILHNSFRTNEMSPAILISIRPYFFEDHVSKVNSVLSERTERQESVGRNFWVAEVADCYKGVHTLEMITRRFVDV